MHIVQTGFYGPVLEALPVVSDDNNWPEDSFMAIPNFRGLGKEH